MLNQTTDQEAPRQRDKGFTLIELIIVVVILGILAGVVIIAVGGLRDDAEEGVCNNDYQALVTAGEAYVALFGAPDPAIAAHDGSDLDNVNQPSTMHSVAIDTDGVVTVGAPVGADPDDTCDGITY